MSGWVNIIGTGSQTSVLVQEVAAVECTTAHNSDGPLAGYPATIVITMKAGRVVTVVCDDYDKALQVSRAIRGEP